jgi:poly-beta-hydroxyalkanoate depolymerase
VRCRQRRAKKKRVLVVSPIPGHHATLARFTVLAMLREP